jgi:hypothetical protein
MSNKLSDNLPPVQHLVADRRRGKERQAVGTKINLETQKGACPRKVADPTSTSEEAISLHHFIQSTVPNPPICLQPRSKAVFTRRVVIGHFHLEGLARVTQVLGDQDGRLFANQERRRVPA